MSSSDDSVEVEASGTGNMSEDTDVSSTTVAAASIETSTVASSQRPRSSSDSQVSETVASEASTSSEDCNSSPVRDDVFNNQSVTNAILEELELMRPTYVFSEDTVRAEGMFSSYLASAIDFSSSSESEDDSDSCISPPASRSSLRRYDPIRGMVDFQYYLRHSYAEYLNRPNMIPRRRRRRPPYFELTRDGVASHSSTGPPTLYRI